MLYERWRSIAGERRREIALRDLTSGQCWTFGRLAAAGEARAAGNGRVAHPQGHSPDFLFDVLAAWRSGQTACPLEAGQARSPVPEPPPGFVHLKMTSATTGTARSVAFTAAQLQADAKNIVATMGLRADWPNLGVISMAHSYGFSNLVLPLLLHGVPLILAPSPLPEAIRRAAHQGMPITLPAVPALWRAWHEARAIPDNVHLAISAGAPLATELERQIFGTTGIKIHNFYGSTECGGIAYDGSESPRSDDACVGSALLGVNLSLNDQACLTVRSEAVGETYWPEPAEELGSGRFQTGDLAELTDDLVFLRGRASDLINVAGRKVSPVVVERALLQHPAVRDCLVFGVPVDDAGRSDLMVACVVSAVTVGRDELRRFLLERLPAWQIPREWRRVDSLPVNERGKISRAEWARRFRDVTEPSEPK